MRVRKCVTASNESVLSVGILVAAVALSVPGIAHAQGSVAPPAGGAPASASSLGDRVFTPPPAQPVTMGETWARALRTVLDGMKRLVDAERIEAEQAVGGPVNAKGQRSTPRGGFGGEAVTAGMAPGPRVGQARASVPVWRSAWTPPAAVRAAIEGTPVHLTPIAVTPPTESPTDTRSEHVVLLGAIVELPWMVP